MTEIFLQMVITCTHFDEDCILCQI